MKRAWILGVLAVLLFAPVAPAADRGMGKIVFASNRADGDRELYVVNADGTGEHRITFNNLFERGAAWSPDGSRIAFAGRAPDGNWDIYTVDGSGGDLRRLTTDPERDDNPRWTADGRIVWQHGPFECPCTAWLMAADGSAATQLPLPGNVLTADPSPRGQKIAYATDAGGSWSIHVAELNGHGDRQITTGPVGFGDFNPRWAPSGNELSFLRDHTGADNDIYVVNANGKDLRQVTNTPNDAEFWQSWSPGGNSLVYVGGSDWHIRSVSLTDGSISNINTAPTAPLSETFDAPYRDASLWYEDNEGGSIGEQGGQLVASISGSAVPGGTFAQVVEQWGSKCQLPGDFDMQVDYSLLTWPAHSGYWTALSAMLADGSVARSSQPWGPPYDEQYNAWANITVPFTSNSVNTTDTAGSMRLVRTSGTLDAYVRSPGGMWTQLLSTPGVTGSAVYGLGLSAQGWDFAHFDGSVAFDNFQLNSGALTCPSWWQDVGADVSKG